MAKAWCSIREARRNLSEVVNRVSYGGERVLLCRRDRAVAAIVSIFDLKWLEHQELLQWKPASDKPPGPREVQRRATQEMIDKLRSVGIDI